MRQLFKQQSIQDLVKYNSYLLITCLLLSIAVFIAIVALLNKEDKWVIIPATEPEHKITISSKMYSETYLRAWAVFVMKELFTTSPAEVERQVADLKVISSATDQLTKFFSEHLEFVKGSRVNSVFFPRNVKAVSGGVLISGSFRYWFDGSDKQVTEEKTYLLTYKRAARQLLLLTNVEEKTE